MAGVLLRLQDFFKSQNDYVYFFYGLAFFILSIICFNQSREKPSRIPWGIFGLFGLIHGLYEWVDMAAIFNEAILRFSAIHLAMLAASYLFLFEFARSILFGRKGRWPFIVIYVLAVTAAASARRYDPNELNAMMRYALALPSGFFASVAVVLASRSEGKGKGKGPLIFLGATILSYAVTTGLIVPKAGIWLSGSLNTDSFLSFTGIPVQVVRGLLVLCAAMAVWFYSQASPVRQPRLTGYRIHFKPSKWTIAITMLTLISLGWAFTNYFDYYASTQIIKSSKADKDSPLNRLNRELTKLEWGAITMSVSARLVYVLSLPAPRFKDRAERLLENYRKEYSAQDCFITDAKGAVIASAGGKAEEACPGGTCADMPYFKDAISGGIGHHFVRGATNEERIYYVSAPIRKTEDGIVGVVVIKKSIAINPILQYRLVGMVITFFMCALAILFFMVLKRREQLIAFAEESNKQLHALDTMKSDFISIVSHELRTPLTAIKSAVALLAKGRSGKGPMDDREAELLDIISDNTDRQVRIVSDLLDISKIENGVMTVKPEKMDMAGLAADVVKSFRQQADNKRIALETVSDRKPLVVCADPEHARRILSNLVHNAIKFTPDGGKVTLAVAALQGEAIITVSDTGPGIPPDAIGKLFNKFYMSLHIPRHKEGSGLGLAISKGLVEAQGGRIWVESEIGQGSSFRFTLPFEGKARR
ncbi:MAG: ATP-binding protein [Candidatus Omnitrophota bacterium]